MRSAGLVVATTLLVVFAGCVAPMAESPSTNETEPTATDTGPMETETDPGTADQPSVSHNDSENPGEDRLGWERGYWYDDPVPVNASDGLNESERHAVISRAMARVERVRGLEFEEPVNISVVSRANYTVPGSGQSHGESFKRFDNAKFEALFLIGNGEDSISVQEGTRNQTIGGHYNPKNGNIVLVSEAAMPEIDGEETLAHELVHALQDQHFDTSTDVGTRDAYNGRNGLLEGDARTVETEYGDRCGDAWACLQGTENASAGGDSDDGPSINLGVYILEYFPYSDGPGLISHLRAQGGWEAVNDAYDRPPTSSATVIHPDRFGSFEPESVAIEDRTDDGWQRVRPGDRPDYAILGQSAVTAMFAYTLYDEYNEDAVIPADSFLNIEGLSVNWTDPFEYAIEPADGWTGDRMHVYERGDETAYVWKIAWESPAEADEFAEAYRDLLRHWGGERETSTTWTVDAESPFTDAFALRVDGDTVTIVNAPSRSAIENVHDP